MRRSYIWAKCLDGRNKEIPHGPFVLEPHVTIIINQRLSQGETHLNKLYNGLPSNGHNSCLLSLSVVFKIY